MRWLPAIIFFIYLYIEISLFVAVANFIGVFFSLILIIVGCVCGFSIIRNQGMRVLFQAQQGLAQGQNPAQEVIKNASILIAGILLLVPGFFTDILGILLLFPPIQKLITLKILPHLNFYRFAYRNTQNSDQGNTYDGEFSRKDQDNDRNNKHLR